MLRTRRVLQALLGVIGGLLLLVILAHTPPARSRILAFLATTLERYEIIARADALDYNLLTFDVRVRGLSLAAAGHADRPFLEAALVHLKFPWTTLWGEWAVEAAEVERLQIAIERAADGSTNLPGADDPRRAPTQPPRLRIGRIALSDLRVHWRDLTADAEVDATGIGGTLVPAQDSTAGALTFDQPVRVRWRDRDSEVRFASVMLAFDGRHLTVGRADLSAPEGRLALRGQIASVLGASSLALDYEATLDAARVGEWVGIREWAGAFALSGRVRGPTSAPEFFATIASQDLLVPRLGPAVLRVTTTIEPTGATLEGLDLRIAGGRLTGRMRSAFDEEGVGSGEAHLEWQGLSADAVIRAWQQSLPLQIAANLDGRVQARWARPDAHQVFLVLESTSRPVRRAGVPLTGSITLSGADGRWTLNARQEIGDAGHFTADAVLQTRAAVADSPLAGTVHFDSARLGRMATLVAASVGGASRESWPLEGSLRIDGTLAGTVAAPTLTLSAHGDTLRYGRSAGADLDARIVATTQAMSIEEIRLVAAAASATLAGNGRIDLDGDRVAGTMQIELGELASVADLLPAWAAPRGAIAADATVAGRLNRPLLQGSISGSQLEIAGQTLNRLTTRLRFDGQTLHLDELQAFQKEGALAATGLYEVASGRYAATLRGQRLSVGQFPPGLAAADSALTASDITIEFSGEGSIEDPVGHGSIEAGSLLWRGSEHGPVSATFRFIDRSMVVEADAPRLRVEAQGSLAVAGPAAFDRFTLDARLDDSPIAELVRLGGFESPTPIAGTVRSRTSATGQLTAIGSVHLRAEVEALDAQVGGSPVRLTQATSLRYDASSLVVEGLQMALGPSTLVVDGGIGSNQPGLSILLTGDLQDLASLAAVAAGDGRAVSMQGPVSLSARTTGTLEHPVFEADLSMTDASLAAGSLAPVQATNLRASYRNGVLALDEFRASWQGATVEAMGSLPLALLEEYLPRAYLETVPPGPRTLRLTARVGSVTPAVLTGIVGAEILERLGGRLSAQLTLEGDAPAIDRLHGELVLSEARIDAAGVSIAQDRATRVTLQEGQLGITDWLWRGPTTELSLAGSVAVSKQPVLALATTGRLDLRLLGAFLPNIATAGQADLDLRITGPISDPRLDGALSIKDGEARLAAPRFVLTSLEGAIALDRSRLFIRSLEGSANGGQIMFGGELRIAGARPAGGVLKIAARSVALDYPVGLRSELDADLSLGFREKALELGGSVTVLRGTYREPITLAAGLLAALRQQQSSIAVSEGSALESLQLNLRLQTRDEIIVDNNLARLQLAGDLRLAGTGARPALLGRAALIEGGLVFLGTNTYRIESGTLDFTNPSRIEPELNLSARTRVAGYDISLSVAGTPADLKTDLEADDPRLSEGDIVSLLVTGRTTAEVGGATAAIAREQALSLVGGEILGAAGRALGLDTVRVDRGFGTETVRFDPTLVATETDPGARLTFSKEVTRDVQLVFSQSLRKSGSFTWIVSYTPLPNIEVRGVVRDDNDRSYEFRHSVSVGAPPRAGIPSGRPSVPPMVTTVRIGGDVEVPEAELRRRLRLREGKRFDFYEWQDDRERLLEYYHERGYREARVGARRIESDRAALALEYAIDRGPLTRLTIEGFDLPGDLRRQLEDTWERSVVDSFLLEDISTRVRQYLIGEGYVRASIAAATTRSDEEIKEITVQVDPGPRFARTRIEFSGNAALSDAGLRSLVEQADLDRVAWLDPLRLGRAIAARYAAEGRLNASVTVQEPQFSDDVAALPVTIDEGPVYHVAALTATGIEARPRESVLHVAELGISETFSEPRLAAARLLVERDYRHAGFNDAVVTSQTVVDHDTASVQVTLTVDEGPRQVLEDVEVIGARRTRPGLIARTLQLEPGEPVDLTEWYRARKRLYDTGVFRSVDIEPDALGPARESGDQPVRARVELQEWPALQLRYGIQVNDEVTPDIERPRQLSLGLAGDLTHQNFLGRGASLGASGRYGVRFRAARVFATTPTLWGLPVLSDVFLSRSREEFGEDTTSPFLTDKTAMTLEQRVPRWRDLQFSYGYTLERNHTFELDARPDDPFAFDITIDIARLNATTTVDTRDDLVDATRGWFHSSSVEYAAERLGSDLRFAKYLAQQFYYRPVGRTVIASAARLGLASAFDQELIPSERFFAGGGNSVRGYPEDSLGPRNIFGDSIGGEALLVLNQEIRFPLAWRFRGVGFLDAGSAFARVSDVSLADLRVGYGVGLRVETPMALLRVDYGRRVRRTRDEPTGRFFFSIGQTF